MGEIWVCGTCRSVNQRRASRCYKCHAPRPPAGQELAAADAPSTRLTPPELAATPGSRHATAPFALVTIALITACVAIRWVGIAAVIGMLRLDLAGTTLATSDVDRVVYLRFAYVPVGLLGTVAWGVWIGRVLRNVPRLGRGWPNVTPRMAIFESVVPLFNLFRAPAVIREVTARLSPAGTAANALIFAWWLMLAGAYFTEAPVGMWISAFAPTYATAIEWSVLMTLLAGAELAVAGVLAVALVTRVERDQGRRAAELAETAASVVA